MKQSLDELNRFYSLEPISSPERINYSQDTPWNSAIYCSEY